MHSGHLLGLFTLILFHCGDLGEGNSSGEFLAASLFGGELLSGIIGMIFVDWFDQYCGHRCSNN
jgi:hypothetical protein